MTNSKRRNTFISKSEGGASLESRQARMALPLNEKAMKSACRKETCDVQEPQIGCEQRLREGLQLVDFGVTLARPQCGYIFSNTALDTASEMPTSYEELLSPWL